MSTAVPKLRLSAARRGVTLPTLREKRHTRKRKRARQRQIREMAVPEGLNDAIREFAEHGLVLKLGRRPGRGSSDDTPHVMVSQGRWHLADWWPTSGTVLLGGRKLDEPIATFHELLEKTI